MKNLTLGSRIDSILHNGFSLLQWQFQPLSAYILEVLPSPNTDPSSYLAAFNLFIIYAQYVSLSPYQDLRIGLINSRRDPTKWLNPPIQDPFPKSILFTTWDFEEKCSIVGAASTLLRAGEGGPWSRIRVVKLRNDVWIAGGQVYYVFWKPIVNAEGEETVEYWFVGCRDRVVRRYARDDNNLRDDEREESDSLETGALEN